MNRFLRTLRRLGGCMCLPILALTGCGGGSLVGIDGSGSKPAVVATGPINGFGSVVVNGVHYNTDNATVYVRGREASESDLSVGEYVTVIGHVNENGEGIASEVHFHPRVTGPIEWLDLDQDQFGVLGQSVKILEDTTFSTEVLPKNITGLQVGQKVSVSGISSSNNTILATRVERVEHLPAEMMGVVEMLNSGAGSFLINQAVVDYSGATIYGTVESGRIAVVRGETNSAGVLVADVVEMGVDYRRLEANATIEVEGFVQSLWGTSLFEIDHVPMRLTGNTVYVGGTMADLRLDKKVRVTGRLDENKMFYVEQLRFLNKSTLQVFGTLQDIYPGAMPQAHGEVQIQNQVVTVRTDTRLIGDLESRIQFSDLRVGDQILVSGYEDNGKVIATSLYVDNRGGINNNIELQGHAAEITDEDWSFVLFDVNVKTTETTQYRDGKESFTAAEFFARWDGQYVEVRGSIKEQLFIAESVRFIVPNFCKLDLNFSELDPRCTQGVVSE